VTAIFETLEVRRLLSTIDVGSYGAFPNNGVDDTAAIQNAINSSNAGDTIHFSTGVFDISSTLTFLPGRTYSGDPGATLHMSSSAVGGSPIAMTTYGSDSNITIQGLTFNANGIGGGINMSIDGGTSVAATNVVIQNCTFENTMAAPAGGWDWAIYTNTGIQNSRINNDTFTNDGGGIYAANPNNFSASSNSFTNILSQDAIFVPINARSFTYGNGIVLSNNTGTGLRRMAVELWGGGGNAPQSPQINNNVFSNWVSGSGECFGISAVAGTNIEVQNNVLSGNADSYGIEIAGTNSDVSGNVIQGFQNGIGIGGAPGVHIHGNTITGSTNAGIQLYNAGHAEGLLIEKNCITDAVNYGIVLLPDGLWYGTIQNNAILRSDAAGSNTFIGISFTYPGTGGTSYVDNNLIVQTSTDHAFWMEGIYAVGIAGMHIDNNVVLSQTTTPWSTGLLAPSSNSLQGVYVTNNTFQNLYWVVGNNQGTPIASGNVAVNDYLNSQGAWTLPLTTVSETTPTAAFSATPNSGTSPLQVSLNSTSTAHAGSITANQWILADGGAGVAINAATTSDVFTSPANTNFVVVLAARDTAGGYGVATQTINTLSAASGSVWSVNTSGDWNNLNNWRGSVPNSPGAEADFLDAITGSHTVYTDYPVTVGKIVLNNPNTYDLTGTGTLTLQAASGGTAEIDARAGTQEINLPTTLASNTVINVSYGATLVIANPLTINAGVNLTQTGGGTVVYQSLVTLLSGATMSLYSSATAQSLSVAPQAAVSMANPNGGAVLQLGGLSLANGGTFNLGTNTLILNYGNGTDPIATIRQEIESGYNGGAWNGAGIDSTAAQTNGGSYGVGYADSADPGNPAGLAPGTIKVMYTLLGDANLDGLVNAADFNIMAANFNQSVTGCDEGDFNYDGLVNAADFAALAANFNQGVNIAAVANAAPVAAPAVASTTPTVATVITESTAPSVVSATPTITDATSKSTAAAPTASKSKPVNVSRAMIAKGKPNASAVTTYAASFVTIPATGSTAAPQNINKDTKFLADR